jgi:hypothetical protein
MAYQVVSKTENAGTSAGPRVEFSDDGGAKYLVIGAFGNINHFDNFGGRPMVIQLSAGLRIIGLTPPPPGTPTHDLVVDANGNVYRQP